MRSRGSVGERLAALQLFEVLPRRQVRNIAPRSTGTECPTETPFGAAEGMSVREFFMIFAGEVEVIHGNRLIATRGPGSHFGEIALLEHERLRQVTLSRHPSEWGGLSA